MPISPVKNRYDPYVISVMYQAPLSLWIRDGNCTELNQKRITTIYRTVNYWDIEVRIE